MPDQLVHISVSGASGVGKTTLVKQLAHLGRVYIEDIERNPHFGANRKSSDPMDMLASQRWFLEQLESFIGQFRNSGTVILDQEPAATVYVYARYALESGRLSRDDYYTLFADLARVEAMLASIQRVEIILTASPAVLRQRVLNRDGARLCPNLAWFEKLVALFAIYALSRTNAVIIDTENVGTASVYERALGAIQDGFKVMPSGKKD